MKFRLVLLLVSSFALGSVSYEPRSHEVQALFEIKQSLKDPHGVLSNWDEFSVDPCSWTMITCSRDKSVISLGAPSQSLSGTLPGAVARLKNLREILLQNNNISGKIPPEIGLLPKLQTLDLSNNRFSGSLPESLGHLASLQFLRLNNNSLSGPFPASISALSKLMFLDLSYNNLSAPVPKFSSRNFNIQGNALICGSKDVNGCSGSTNNNPLSSSSITSSPGTAWPKRFAIALGFTIGLLSLLVVALGILHYRRTRHNPFMHKITVDKQEEGQLSLGNLRSFSFKELQTATHSFSNKNILGSGGFGNVYKGKLVDGTIVAVKRLKDMSGTSGEYQFQMELELISLAVHRNLLRLIGYCATSSERLLVYPYMSNGSVASRLRGKPPLDWNTRKRIAIGAARALFYLHEQCDPKIIHRDVKAANVLLDEYCEAVVGDFGLAKLLDHSESHVTTAVRGTVGHIAPEYLSTGQSSEKTDVFGFGILLLELITGMRALEFGKTVSQKGAMLDWVRKVQEEKKVQVLVDRALGTSYDRIEVLEMLQVALLCTQYMPAQRPRMSEVVLMLEGDGLAGQWAEARGQKDIHIGITPFHAWSRDDNENTHNKLVKATSIMQSSLGANATATLEDEDEDDDVDVNSMDSYAMELSGPR